ncbi:LysR family transcriptional regulator [Ruminococcus gauvreauii]|uniref:LysR family transcriptional regulator n=1 Tax=Ruminococcus gauvreauii TaxID=438033 RepID=A0ABY5VD43_9FIRM|nr:LysR family transcriptional regulator [Ruminococcus gauvreauii]UWP58151.1 LysR family transcriptional regulator [Ruminococcus gauvreauii]
MTLRHLRIFIAVAETKSMSEAARQCFITQPTVSQTIHELEEHYGTQLFERLSRKLYITDSGTRLLSYARQVVDQFEILEHSMLDNPARETLHIGATITVGTCLLPQILNDFEQKMPGIDTYACISNTAEIEQKLLDSSLDIGIVEGNVQSPELISIPMIEDYLVLACDRSHPFATRRIIRAEELEYEKFVMRESGSGTRALFEHYLHRHNLQVTIGWEANSPLAIRNAILYNRGLSVISVRLFEQEILTGDIHVICLASREWERTFKLVYHKNKYLTPSIEAMRSILPNYRRPDFLGGIEVGLLQDNMYE